MKKLFIALSAAVFALVACNKEAPVVENEPAEATKLAFDFNVNHSDDTKAVKTAWETGDKIYVFFEGVFGEGKYLTLTYDFSTTSWNPNLNELAVGDFSDGAVNMHAVFFPFEQPEITAVDEGFTFKTKSEGHTAATAGLGIYTYYMEDSITGTAATAGDTRTLSGTLSMTLPAGFVQFYIPANVSEYNEDYRYRLSIEGINPLACVAYNADYKYGSGVYDKYIPATANGFSTKKLAAGQPMWGYKYGEGIAFSGVIDGTWESAANHIIYLFDTEAAAKTKTVKTTLASHAAVKFSSVGSWGPAATADSSPLAYSSTAWARFNLGATAEGAYGWYFAWGDIIPVRGTTAEDAPSGYARMVPGNNSTPRVLLSTLDDDVYYDNTVASEAIYARGINLTDSYVIYDAARAFLGSPWRMPSLSEVSSLITDPVISWDSESCAAIVNGINIPSAGLWSQDSGDSYSDSSTGSHKNGGPGGRLWTSSVNTSGNRYGSRLGFSYTDRTIEAKWGANREYGLSVRPVRDL